jgi:hypothetical protein
MGTLIVRTGEEGTEATDGDETVGGDNGFEIGLVAEFNRRYYEVVVGRHVDRRSSPDISQADG